jgi:hypothetical protein
MTERSRATVVAILLGGLVAGTIDIGAACVINHRSLDFILHSIAGGLLAKQSFSGGTGTAVLGALLQEAMGVLIATIYVLAALRLPSLLRRWLPLGLAYGIIIFFVMNYVVLPLSAWHTVPQFSATTLVANVVAMLLFGVIVSYFAHRELGRPLAVERE